MVSVVHIDITQHDNACGVVGRAVAACSEGGWFETGFM